MTAILTSDSAIGNLNLATIRTTISAIVFQVCVPATCALVPTPAALNPRLFFQIRHEGVFGFTEADAIACNSPPSSTRHTWSDETCELVAPLRA